MNKIILLIFCPVILMGASGPGHLLLNNGTRLDGQVSFDENKHLVTIYLTDTSYSLTPSQVNRFEFTDSKSSIRRIFLGPSINGLEHQQQFFELMLSGTITLMRVRRHHSGEWTINHPNHMSRGVIPESYHYFILYQEQLAKVRNFKKSLSNIMGNHWEAAWEYGHKQARQHQRVVAYIMAINFYNLLVDPNYPGINTGYVLAVNIYQKKHMKFKFI